MTVTKESGKTLTYEKELIDIMILKSRILENEERRERLGMEIDKVVDIKIEK